ncbi:hypothetical protein [Streptomyces peucetius]|uniref:Gram-positive cocci surface proteins LPxTG domain-containing protein n=1 Tax=Streptomyces peucetius TaxID=1950 RepID=A0ABY6I5L5_STRPE|nr:hypothetical protein [Streptomyces peucetius]UYQ62293.1 hypothetical protein OGH68_12930 [Streptomyces peucetius]
MRTRNALALTAATTLIAPAVISGSAAEAAATGFPARHSDARHARAAAPAQPAVSERPVAPAEDPAADRPGDLPADRAPTCGRASDPDFPITTRIHGGPATVRAGSGFHSWSVELTNDTRENCDRIHPVLVLTAKDRTLTADSLTVEFHDRQADRWRPVTLERTTQDEFVGVFDDGFQGFAVPAGGTVTVRTRLSVAAGAAADEVTVNAAIVQRKGDDGDWVGESGDYRFAVVESDGEGEDRDGEHDGGRSADPTPARSAEEPPPAPASAPAPVPAGKTPPSTGGQIATTGSGSLTRVGVGGVVILLSAALLAFVARRLRPGAGRR